MHQHICKNCENKFVCGEDAAKCFQTFITCDDCFWKVEVWQWLFAGLVIATVVGVMTLLSKNS